MFRLLPVLGLLAAASLSLPAGSSAVGNIHAVPACERACMQHHLLHGRFGRSGLPNQQRCTPSGVRARSKPPACTRGAHFRSSCTHTAMTHAYMHAPRQACTAAPVPNHHPSPFPPPAARAPNPNTGAGAARAHACARSDPLPPASTRALQPRPLTRAPPPTPSRRPPSTTRL